MVEQTFLDAVGARLGAVGLTPSPATIGVLEPALVTDLPALVLSLDASARLPGGIGEGLTLMLGALPWTASLDLANPVLPDDASVRLLDDTRRILTLPQGGLVQHTGTEGPLTGADATVKVGGASRTVVAGTPGAGQVAVDPSGVLTFGDALPATGTVTATFFLGQWSRAISRISGTLRLDACATDAGVAAQLVSAAIEALAPSLGRAPIPGLEAMAVAGVGSVGLAEAVPAGLRRRTARFSFLYAQIIDAPDSAGGVIRTVPITTHLHSITADARTGALTETDVVETS